MINVGGNLPPEILQQQQALNRQQQMAQLLMQQGQSMPSGQMVSGRYVAPSFFQYAAPLFQSYAGTKLAEKGDKTALDIAKQLRQQYANEAQQYQNLLRGQEQTFEQAGPTQAGGNIPNQTYRTGADPQAAYLFGSTAYNPVLQQASAKKMLEGPKYKEVTQYNQQTGNTEIYRYDENSQNPRDTMQFIGISKPAISPEAQIRFGDENINIPAQFRGGAVGQPQGQPTSAYGANVQFTPNQSVGAPQGQPQVTPNVAPTVASTVVAASAGGGITAGAVADAVWNAQVATYATAGSNETLGTDTYGTKIARTVAINRPLSVNTANGVVVGGNGGGGDGVDGAVGDGNGGVSLVGGFNGVNGVVSR